MRGIGRWALGLVAMAAFLRPAPLEGQVGGGCGAVGDSGAVEVCNLVVQAMDIAQPKIGLAAMGGNPVPGTASTLGMRIGALPRISLGARITGAWTDLPQVLQRERRGDIDFVVTGVNLDGSIGLFRGYSPAPTIGGVGSIDLLGSIGFVSLPGDEGFDDDSPFTWAIGTRIGVFRESFTVPGVSATLMYRRVGGATFGDPRLLRADAFFDLEHISIFSLRAAASKRLFGFGATAGLGYDRYLSDVRFGFNHPGGPVSSSFLLSADGFDNDRFLFFGNVSWTLLILSLVAEAGWQEGADDVEARLPIGFDPDRAGGRFFGSLAIRLTI